MALKRREFVSHRNLDRRLDIQIPTRDHGTRLAQLPAHRRARGIANTGISQPASIRLPLTQIECSAEHTGHSGKTKQPFIMPVNLVPQAGIPVRIEPNHAIDVHRRCVREHDAIPNHLDTVLPIRNSRIVPADQSRTLGNEQITSGCRVVHIRHHQRFEVPRQIGVETLLEYSGNLPSRFDFVRSQRCTSRRAKVVIRLQ